MRKYLVTAAAVGAMASLAHGTIIVNLSSPQAGETVPVGSIIHAVVTASTDNPDGIAQLQTRLQTSLDGTNPDNAPFHVSLIATNPNNTTSNQPVVSTFGPAATIDSNATLAKATARFASNGQPAVTPTGDEPLFGYTGYSGNGRLANAGFYSPSNQTLQEFFDVSFRADNPGAVQFGFSSLANSLSGSEFTMAPSSGDTTSAATAVNVEPGSGFTVTVAPTPEPATLGLLGLIGGGLLIRRRR